MADTPVCAYCRTRPVEARWRPFCSQRCQLLDLARWADGSYHVAGEKPDQDDNEHDEKSEV
jgi:endogenous inhibitor of DNA gyrase (YacG/DUF329 family)